MTKILFITVGGSHQPIATSIKSQNPDRVVFICSDGAKGSKSQVIGEGKPCEVRKGTEVIESLPNIPTQLGLGDRFDAERDLVLIQEPDNLTECYSKINQKIREVKQESPRAEIAADYTGGTKTMSVALATAALDSEINLFITTSTTRQNLIKVESGERTRKATTTGVVVTKTVDKALPVYLQNYNYTAAIADLQNLLQSTELSSDQTRQIDELLDQCEGFDAWDRFDHRVALSRLQPYMRQTNIQPYGLFLKKVIASRGLLDKELDTSDGMTGHGYEVVEDLLLNADRRASQKRYDDAVGRLYRAIELLEQIRLFKQYGILTGDVDISKLPAQLQTEYEARKASNTKKKLQLALFQSYDLLSKFTEDPLGQLFLVYKDRILNSLETRNNSLFAHGFQPISENSYRAFNQVIGGFIREGIAVVSSAKTKSSSRQFPQTL
ncbi:MAG: TIGR02710 family CRISPR-associated CARF protein [Pseudanabaena sp.]|jgi:CRISPR-associated protein (TIGR02710 family)|nr:TIGR02710 family CRISPR-associated protein [Pseudanabaena sp. M109S1SP2A07QC]MCA6524300.1 TIGR02710 family CRISPR-associated protein [Pseudanabaena sp. M051S1SP2A07QC]MCA6575174.1 TIGR02710 family CRISPR-associated protein [Pseudanabaena sp. M53BS1SP1A06MG]MCA6582053.1 TIGR02710 family CRISPR-associated protein [Pseudanabaena sp. M34BS1SP1A06MG]MCA6594700.1 TIGR02710 family CRISPR-associated protein [Pseudanabaena sp. M38BS1SP1A06MG]MCA6602844.1 TIGR02710 family CRISPR-associated protein [P